MMSTQAQRRSDGRTGKELNIGIVGCGQIAEHHLRFIHRTEGARVAALSDPVSANAQRFAAQYGVQQIHASHLEMLDRNLLDVVHILTPPEFHYSQARDAIDRGVHVFLEKPCTIYPEELEDLYRRADAKGVLLCPDFIQLFNPTFLQAADLIDSGQLGDVIHIEIHLSVDLNTPNLREAIGLPWRFNLPGGILHDNITHPLYMALRWLGEPAKAAVFPHAHGVLPQGLTDHLSIMLEGKHSTANIVISALIKPEPYYVQVFCARGTALVNFDTSSVLVTRHGKLPRFIKRATANFAQARQLFASGMGNMIRFARGRLLPYQGLDNLIPRFYDSIRNRRELPISKELALAVARTEAKIFAQAGKLHLEAKNRVSTQKSITRAEKVLLTGATGYLGSVVAAKLVREGYYVRVLVRELSHTERLEELGVEFVHGDIRDAGRVIEAANGMDIVIHMAAALRGSVDFMLDCAVKGTQNVAAAAGSADLKRVIYVSSMSVYDALALHSAETVSEDFPLEEFAHLRGTYSLAKRRAEDEAMSHLREPSTGWTILRPSLIVGRGSDVFAPVGVKLGNLLFCPGSPKRFLALIHVNDLATALIKVIQNGSTAGHIFNVSAEGITQREYIDEFIRNIGYENLRVVYIPYWLARCAASTFATLRLLNPRIPSLHKRRLASLYQNARVATNAIMLETGWQPRKNLLQTLVTENQESRTITPDCVVVVPGTDLPVKNNPTV